jgi:adenosine deaminase CECR1
MGDIRNVRDTLIMGAERLGHAVKLREDPIALEYARLQQIPVEANLTSNIRLQGVSGVGDHPFLDYLRLGLKVSLSTDDEGILETDINQECVLAIRDSDLAYEEMKQMALNSIGTSFASESLKASLMQELKGNLARFEEKWHSLEKTISNL